MLVALKNIPAVNLYKIYTHVFRPSLNKIYFSTYEKPKDISKYFVQVDLVTGVSKEIEVKLEATFFEAHYSDPEIFFFIEDKIIYKMGFVVKRTSSFGFFGTMSKAEEGQKELFGAEEFFRSKQMIDFVRFDRDMSSFFINEGKSIKQIDFESFEVLKIFDQQSFNPNDVVFCPRFKFLYS